jgi:hypothetical protein
MVENTIVKKSALALINELDEEYSEDVTEDGFKLEFEEYRTETVDYFAYDFQYDQNFRSTNEEEIIYTAKMSEDYQRGEGFLKFMMDRRKMSVSS